MKPSLNKNSQGQWTVEYKGETRTFATLAEAMGFKTDVEMANYRPRRKAERGAKNGYGWSKSAGIPKGC